MQNSLSFKFCPYEFKGSNLKAKKAVFYAFVFTFLTMVLEIIAGSVFNSMALLADGWHMSSHTLALALALFAYILANRYLNDERFNFGTYKLEILSAYTSALFLLVVAFLMVYHSIESLINPQPIAYKEAIIVAFLGLFVNIFCAWLLKEDTHNHLTHSHHCEDLNLKAAYVHVLTDALTSILAIIALFGALFFAWWWLDALMGLVGAVLVFLWALNLIKQSGAVLLDMNNDKSLLNEILKEVKELGVIKDLHLVKIAKEEYTCILSLKSKNSIKEIKARLSKIKPLSHILIEKEEEDL